MSIYELDFESPHHTHKALSSGKGQRWGGGRHYTLECLLLSSSFLLLCLLFLRFFFSEVQNFYFKNEVNH